MHLFLFLYRQRTQADVQPAVLSACVRAYDMIILMVAELTLKKRVSIVIPL